ncbi:hypothetical protein RclHR1_05460010 [Rhizophagus clarus]|uniref:Uncharacterized protein n=1 Tax=Rhizophagus clarus TaxID=94130 RepID=A0A2Z6SF12_9GLOM|nr:hypothetical protein RclHR1_05460010 [Rhizophagus clarus]GES91371.1 hypothetical protein GLOIN_2v1635604 [Rhizophagus clarus]
MSLNLKKFLNEKDRRDKIKVQINGFHSVPVLLNPNENLLKIRQELEKDPHISTNYTLLFAIKKSGIAREDEKNWNLNEIIGDDKILYLVKNSTPNLKILNKNFLVKIKVQKCDLDPEVVHLKLNENLSNIRQELENYSHISMNDTLLFAKDKSRIAKEYEKDWNLNDIVQTISDNKILYLVEISTSNLRILKKNPLKVEIKVQKYGLKPGIIVHLKFKEHLPNIRQELENNLCISMNVHLHYVA